jgi:colanic acid/amylovoran biosynthesis protein
VGSTVRIIWVSKGNFVLQERMSDHSGTYKYIVVFNVFGHLNGGDAMLIEALYSVLREMFPRARIEGIAFDPVSEHRWMPQMHWHERIANANREKGGGRIGQLFRLAVACALASSRSAYRLRYLLPEKQRSAVESLRNCDLAISAPGGYLEDSNHAYILNLIQMLIAHRLAQRVILAPQSIGPVRSLLGRFCMRIAMRRTDRVFVRERWSEDFLLRLLGRTASSTAISPVISKAGDMAFWFHENVEERTVIEAGLRRLVSIDDRKIVGMTLVDWRFPGFPDADQRRENYIASICRLVEHIEIRGTHKVVIFNQVASDLPVSHEVKRRCPSVVIDEEERSSSLLSALIGKADVFIGTRFHSCLFALMQSVPTYAIAYLPKTTGIMADLGLQSFAVPIESVTAELLIEQFESLAADRKRHSDLVAASVLQYRVSHGSFIDYLQRGTTNPTERV